ncbi:MAG: 6-phosphofructokinase [Lentisphaerae bacterium]|nr:6-phosphofructokinase [Lentisphaerota bacterium]
MGRSTVSWRWSNRRDELGNEIDCQAMCKRLCAGRARGKTSSIIIVAEGAHHGGAYGVAEELRALSGNEYRVAVLGYLQRGGAPTASDRLLAARLGAFAVEVALKGATNVMVGEVGGELTLTPLEKVWTDGRLVDSWMIDLARKLAT